MTLPAEIVQAFAKLGTATIHEAQGRLGELDPAIGPLFPGARLSGPAFPVECQPADNLMIHYALAAARSGDVLVIATGGAHAAGYWGLITTRAAMARGLAGLVLDGGVRDSAEIEALGFPVFCRGRAIKGTTKVGVGREGITLAIGGQVVAPGDLVVGDRDGVVVVPQARASAVLAAAVARDEREAGMLGSVDGGALTVDLLDLRRRLEESGLL